MKLLALIFVAATVAVPAAAAPSPDLSSLALGKTDLAGMTVTQQGYVAPPPGSHDPLRHFNRVFTLAPGGVLQHGESDVALYSSHAAASAAIDALAQTAHEKDYAAQVAKALKVKRLTLLRVHSLKLGDQSLEVAYRYAVAGKANPTEESLAFVRVGAIVQRIWLVGQRVDEGTVRRLAALVEARTSRAKQ